MKRREWQERLDGLVEQVPAPICPSFCCFTQVCPDWVQQGVNRLFVDGSYKDRTDCIWYQKYAPFTRASLGTEPPATAEEFFEMVLERRAIREEAS